ncbi:bifunctional aldolase/short-chain dehydrogenase [Deinococcus roseus]|uniref:Oxidoreductase YuxG n=1 Tax=Deinococcus roseus TaxID=392414 RepID=A0ABQ2DH34_9DEIO|nr:bifunctional aldolase/short-chain dehydrogenase [Deinococcus roseus]GGJ55984.1 putative oxidoreductase YuxG [Deinococcus roseus]
MPKNLWNTELAPQTDGLDALTYRSQLLGSDRTLVNIYGGNTSVKSTEKDHVGRDVEVLWVKGSGSDIATITSRGFAGLKLDEVLPLIERESMTDEEMTQYLDRTTFEPGRPRQSIETLLHAFVPFKHVDHTHPDAIIALACSPDGEQVMRKIYGDRAAWVPYIRPGFTLSKQIGEAVRNNPHLECVVMGKHGLVTWGNTSEESYLKTLSIIQEAEDFIAAKLTGDEFGPQVVESVPAADRRRIYGEIAPVLRSSLGKAGSFISIFDDSEEVLSFVNSEKAPTVSQVGAACPDHLVHVKRTPMFVNWKPEDGLESLETAVQQASEAYLKEYAEYFDAHKGEGDKMFPAYPRVILIPGLGMVNTGSDIQNADVSNQLYYRAIAVIRGAEALGGFVSLSAAEAFAIEYWPLELYKLSLKPAPRSLAGKVAFVTGGASGIGKSIVHRLAAEGAHVVVADINAEGSAKTVEEVEQKHGKGKALAVHCDVTSEQAIQNAFQQTLETYGVVDVVVSNAGIASSAPIEETSLAMWELNQKILSTGYFLVSREAFKVWRKQNVGGSLVYVASKNSVAAGKNAAAYSAAKAAELHLARCLAEEGGAAGIRVNTVLPDAVLSGSSIWDGKWRAERAATYGIAPDQLEEHYRKRTTLRVNVFPEDIAEAVKFFATSDSAKTTGGVLTVDGGVPIAYVR